MKKNLIDLKIGECFQFTKNGPVHQLLHKDHNKEILIYSSLRTGIKLKYNYWNAINKKVIIENE